MRLFKVGSLKNNSTFGVRVLVVNWMNPLIQITDMLKAVLWLRKTGYIRVLRLPCFKIFLVVNNHKEEK